MSLRLPGPLLELMQSHLRQNVLPERLMASGGHCAPASRRARYNEIFRRHVHALALKTRPEGNSFVAGQRESQT